MRTALDQVTEAASAEGLSVAKAMPRSAGHLGVELRQGDGGVLAGQWFHDRDEARAVCAQTSRAAPGGGVRLLPDGLVLQPGGADRKLSGVRRLAESAGATVVAHRPEKRAVLRLALPGAETTYVKVVRPRRVERTLSGAGVTVDGVATAQLRAVDRQRGTVTFAELPGRTLYDLLGDHTVTDGEIEKVGYAVGEAVRRLHSTAARTDLPTHDAAAELAVTRRWVGLAADHHLLGERSGTMQRLISSAGDDLTASSGPPVLLHRDLHDKQLLVDGLEIGMLDFDLAALGDPALDLANLLTHLELRARQGRCSLERAQRCATAVRDGYGPVPADWRQRIAGYQLTTRVRLACVYAFRPAHPDVAGQLVPAATA